MASTDSVTGSDDELPLIALVSSGHHLYREYLLQSIADHARIWLLLDAEPTWELPYLTGFSVLDTLDAPAMITATEQATEVAGLVSGVICWDELRLVATAELATALGVPTSPPEAVGRCRDKHLTRQALHKVAAAQPRSGVAHTLNHAAALAKSIGYPVVVKPRSLGSSIGVTKVAGPTELATAYTRAGSVADGVSQPDNGILVEECVLGNEISIDSAIVNGLLRPLFVARKKVGFQPYCEEVGHTVDAADPLLDDPDLIDLLAKAHRAVGYTNGITHTDVMLTEDGPKIIEINSSLGGDLIPRVASVATGLDVGQAAVSVACGRLPDAPNYCRTVAQVDFLYPEADVIVEHVRLTGAEYPVGVEAIVALTEPGEVLELPPVGHIASRYGYVITHGQTELECHRSSAAARAQISLRSRPRDVRAQTYGAGGRR